MYGEARLQKIIAKERKKIEVSFHSKPFHDKLQEAKLPEFKNNLDNIQTGYWKACREAKVLYSN